MKKVLLIFAFLCCLLPNTLMGQKLRKISIEIIADTTIQRSPSFIFWVRCDSTFHRGIISRNLCSTYFVEDDDLSDAILVLLIGDKNVVRVKYRHLAESGCTFSLLGLKLRLIEDVVLSEEDSAKKIGLSHRYYGGNFLGSLEGFTPDVLEEEFGYYKCYYPSDSLIRSSSVYNWIASDSSFLYAFEHWHGHFPSQIELDSCMKFNVTKEAIHLSGLLSYIMMELKEPSFLDEKPNESYRLAGVSIYSDVTYNPYVIRVEPIGNGGAVLYVKYKKWAPTNDDLVYANKSSWGDMASSIIYGDAVFVQQEEFQQFKKLFNQVDFWQSDEVLDDDNLLINSSLIMEVYRDSLHHAVFRRKGSDVNIEQVNDFLWNLIGLGKNAIISNKILYD